MDLSGIADTVSAFFRDNPFVAVAVGLLFLFLLIRKPKLLLLLFSLGLILAAALYFIENVVSTGKAGKTKMIEKGTSSETDQVR
jgi:hypothetical protein